MRQKIRLSEAALAKMIKESVLAELDRRKVMPAKYYDIFKSRVTNAMHGRFGEVERAVTEFYKDFRDRIPNEDFTFENLMELAEKIEDWDNSAGREWGNAEGHKVKNAEGWWAINKGKFLEEGKVRLNESQLKRVIAESVTRVLNEIYSDAKRDEEDPEIARKAQELYDQVDLEHKVSDWADNYGCDVNLWGEIEDENGGLWKFEGWGSGVNVGGGDIEIDRVEEMNYESPDGHTGSIQNP